MNAITRLRLLEQIQPLSIRARQAIGAICLTRFCRAYSIEDESINELLDQLWALTSADDLTEWERKGSALELTGRGDPLPASLSDKVCEPLRSVFEHLVGHVVEIGLCDMYGAITSESEKALMVALEILTDHNIVLPDLRVFAESSFIDDGWGEAIPRVIVAKWKRET